MDETTSATKPKKSRNEAFIATVIESCKKDKGLNARLKRADNPAMEYQSWDFIAGFGINLEKKYERVPFITVAAAIAKSKTEENGSVSLGEALAACYQEKQGNTQAQLRLRRLLACTELTEVVRHLRPLLTLIESKTTHSLDYLRLLRQLQGFTYDDQRIKAQWAQEFYGRPSTQTNKEA